MKEVDTLGDESGQHMTKLQRFLAMKPLLLRSLIVAVGAVLAKVFNITFITDDIVSAVVDLFTALSAMIAYLWGQGTVTANRRVILATSGQANEEARVERGGAEGLEVRTLLAAEHMLKTIERDAGMMSENGENDGTRTE